ncbi:Nn.00g034070.m01.CDS01 [Neocucurbitaria sp. VM-36]
MASNEQTIVLITGANGGIGFELAAQLLASAKYFVLLGSRSLEKGQAEVQNLQQRNLPGKVSLVQIDVSDENSINNAAKEIDEKYGQYVILFFPSPIHPCTHLTFFPSSIDALINNAAITSETPTTHSLSLRLSAAFLTNATGPALVVEAFAPLLTKSTHKTPRIVNVTSGAGSIAMRLDSKNPHQQMRIVPYRVSKAALNMVTACQAWEYGGRGWVVVAFCPGFTESGLSPHSKEEFGAKPTSEGARPIVDILEGKRDAEHGGFLNATGQYPW